MSQQKQSYTSLIMRDKKTMIHSAIQDVPVMNSVVAYNMFMDEKGTNEENETFDLTFLCSL